MEKTRKIFCLLCAVMLGCTLFACTPAADPAEPAVSAETAAPAPSDPVEAAATADELNALIEQYQAAGDFDGVYRAALKLTELEPGNTNACLIAADALIAINEQNEQEVKRILAQNLANAPGNAEIVSNWLEANGMTGAVAMPFLPDYADVSQINSDGSTVGNLTNALRSGYWISGCAATQAGWVYYARFTDDYAIYKMRLDGGEPQKLGEMRGYSINVVGDWLYYVNLSDGSKPYRVRTDGSELQKLADYSCAFLSVNGDWVYTDGYGESGALGRFRTDGSEPSALTDYSVAHCAVSGDWVYFFRKSMDEPGIWRIRTDGSETQVLVNGFPKCYAQEGETLYYAKPDDPRSVVRCSVDGSNAEEIFRTDEEITALNVSGNTLIIAYGISYSKDEFILSKTIAAVSLTDGKVLKEWDAQTEPLCVGEGYVFYTEEGKGMAWQCVNLETFEEIPME